MDKKNRKPRAFMSYAHIDDDDSRLTEFREKLEAQTRKVFGEEFPIFQDCEDIAWGEEWEARIDESLAGVTFFIPIITPSFFRSQYCRDELTRFLEREESLGLKLILPVYYIDTPLIRDESRRSADELAQKIASRQYVDCRDLIIEDLNSEEIRRLIFDLAKQICNALEQLSPEETEPPSAEPESHEMNYQARNNASLLRRTDALNSIEHSRKAVSHYRDHDQLVEKLKRLRNEMEKLVGPLYANRTDPNIFISNDENDLLIKMLTSESRIRDEFYKTDLFWRNINKNLYLSQSDDLTMLLKTYMKCIDNYRRFISAESHDARKLLAKKSTNSRLYKAENIVYNLEVIIEIRYDKLAEQIKDIEDEL